MKPKLTSFERFIRLWSLEIKQGGTIRYLIAVLLSALLTILIVPHQDTPKQQFIHKQMISIKKSSQLKQKVPAKRRVGTKSKQTLTAPAIKPEPQVANCSSYIPAFRQYNWNVNVAVAICEAESRGNPNAISPINYDGLRDYGLMQLHGEPILNPARNIAAAYVKYQTQGWEAWTTYNSGRYLAYL